MPEKLGRRFTTDERGSISMAIRKEMKVNIDRLGVKRALEPQVPAESDAIFEKWEYVLIWREKEHCNKNSPYRITSVNPYLSTKL